MRRSFQTFTSTLMAVRVVNGKDHTAPATDEGKGPAAACCGLFSTSAVVTDLRVLLPIPLVVSQILPFPQTGVDGQGPGRIIRPPIA